MTDESRAWAAANLPKTYTVSTGAGQHLYYRTNAKIGNKVGIFPGIDVRGEGGYVVAPPSIHPNGHAYTIVDAAQIADVPPAFTAVLDRPKAPVSAGGGDVHEGGRNQYLTQVAGVLQRRGLLTLEALLSINDNKCNPPLDGLEVETIFNSISRYTPEAPVIVKETGRIIRAGSLFGEAMAGIMDKEKVKGLSTGIAGLDKMLGGGYRLGEFVALSASAKTGKSSFIAQLIKNLMDANVPVGYASREMDPSSEVLPNLWSMHFKQNVWLTDIKNPQEYQAVTNSWPLYFANGYGYFPFSEIREWALELKSIGVHYIFLDHLHYTLEDPEDYKAAVKLAQELKTLTKELQICLFAVIQPGKLMEGQKLGFNNMRGGAGVAQALDSVLILDRHRVEGREVRGISKLTLDIARHKLARPGNMYLEYDFNTTEFHEVAPAKAEDPMPPGFSENP
jgi:hypothetical protein